jgi:hypothetical protein
MLNVDENWDKYSSLIRNGKQLPHDFPFWSAKDPAGTSLAHHAAKYRLLPNGFDRWEVRDAFGWSVAHYVAIYDDVPPHFMAFNLRLHPPSKDDLVSDMFLSFHPESFYTYGWLDSGYDWVAQLAPIRHKIPELWAKLAVGSMFG